MRKEKKRRKGEERKGKERKELLSVHQYLQYIYISFLDFCVHTVLTKRNFPAPINLFAPFYNGRCFAYCPKVRSWCIAWFNFNLGFPIRRQISKVASL